MAKILLGNVKGPTGATGATGAQGEKGDAATVSVGTVSTTAYGNPASVTNSGTEHDAVLDFVIPQGMPGEHANDASDMTVETFTPTTASFPVPIVGDAFRVIMGKLTKWMSDIRSAVNTKFDKSKLLNSFAATETGYALDAMAGKALRDLIRLPAIMETITIEGIEIAAGGTATVQETYDSKDGYTAQIVTVYPLNNTRVLVGNRYLSGGKVIFATLNTGTSNSTVNFAVRMIYLKNIN